MLSQSLRHPGLKAFHFEAFFTGEAAEPARRPISFCLTLSRLCDRCQAPAPPGTLALRRPNEGFAVEAVKPRDIDRPWLPSAGGDSTDAGTTDPVSRPAHTAVDATPSEADLQADE
jgi:hypothetical protein